MAVTNDLSSLSSENVNSTEIFDGSTQEALDLLFTKDQQTYDEFLNSFLYLKYKDERISLTATQPDPLPPPEVDDVVERDICDVTTDDDANYDRDLQEEFLGPGQNFSSDKDGSNPSRLQLDNFVDDESLQCDSNHVSYCPSICEAMSQKGSQKETISCSSSLKNSGGGLKNRITLPGETDIYDATDVEINTRCLNVCTTPSKSREINNRDQGSTDETQSYEVVSFKMDDNFDYDSVYVQPKFYFISNT